MKSPEEFKDLLNEYTNLVSLSHLDDTDEQAEVLKTAIIKAYEECHRRCETNEHLLNYSDLSA